VLKTAKEILTVNFSYLDMNKMMKLVKEEELEIIAQHFDNNCEMELAVPLSKKDKVLNELHETFNLQF
jgi:putative IMPACT (imprinted ancient) family translation regulator